MATSVISMKAPKRHDTRAVLKRWQERCPNKLLHSKDGENGEDTVTFTASEDWAKALPTGRSTATAPHEHGVDDAVRSIHRQRSIEQWVALPDSEETTILKKPLFRLTQGAGLSITSLSAIREAVSRSFGIKRNEEVDYINADGNIQAVGRSESYSVAVKTAAVIALIDSDADRRGNTIATMESPKTVPPPLQTAATRTRALPRSDIDLTPTAASPGSATPQPNLCVCTDSSDLIGSSDLTEFPTLSDRGPTAETLKVRNISLGAVILLPYWRKKQDTVMDRVEGNLNLALISSLKQRSDLVVTMDSTATSIKVRATLHCLCRRAKQQHFAKVCADGVFRRFRPRNTRESLQAYIEPTERTLHTSMDNNEGSAKGFGSTNSAFQVFAPHDEVLLILSELLSLEATYPTVPYKTLHSLGLVSTAVSLNTVQLVVPADPQQNLALVRMLEAAGSTGVCWSRIMACEEDDNYLRIIKNMRDSMGPGPTVVLLLHNSMRKLVICLTSLVVFDAVLIGRFFLATPWLRAATASLSCLVCLLVPKYLRSTTSNRWVEHLDPHIGQPAPSLAEGPACLHRAITQCSRYNLSQEIAEFAMHPHLRVHFEVAQGLRDPNRSWNHRVAFLLKRMMFVTSVISFAMVFLGFTAPFYRCVSCIVCSRFFRQALSAYVSTVNLKAWGIMIVCLLATLFTAYSHWSDRSQPRQQSHIPARKINVFRRSGVWFLLAIVLSMSHQPHMGMSSLARPPAYDVSTSLNNTGSYVEVEESLLVKENSRPSANPEVPILKTGVSLLARLRQLMNFEALISKRREQTVFAKYGFEIMVFAVLYLRKLSYRLKPWHKPAEEASRMRLEANRALKSLLNMIDALHLSLRRDEAKWSGARKTLEIYACFQVLALPLMCGRPVAAAMLCFYAWRFKGSSAAFLRSEYHSVEFPLLTCNSAYDEHFFDGDRSPIGSIFSNLNIALTIAALLFGRQIVLAFPATAESPILSAFTVCLLILHVVQHSGHHTLKPLLSSYRLRDLAQGKMVRRCVQPNFPEATTSNQEKSTERMDDSAVVASMTDDPYKFLNRFCGKWRADLQMCEDMDETSKVLGVPWGLRQLGKRFVPICLYTRPELKRLIITQLLPLNQSRDVELVLTGEPYSQGDKEIGSWISTATVDRRMEKIFVERRRESDGLIVRETRELRNKSYNPDGSAEVSQDKLAYCIEVFRHKDRLTKCWRYFDRVESPPSHLELPKKSTNERKASKVRVIQSAAELWGYN